MSDRLESSHVDTFGSSLWVYCGARCCPRWWGAQQRGGSRVLDVVSLVCGWAYFFCWSASFYPQVFLNWRRKSVVGLSLDYQLLNIFGYLSYFSFNAALFWSKHVQEEYRREHNGKDSAVRFNDVMFSGHAMVLTSVTLWQIFHYWDYPPLQRKESLFRAAVVSSCVLYSVTVGVCLFLVISTGENCFHGMA